MSTTQSTPPGIRGQRSARIAFRGVGMVLLVVALGLLAVGIQNFFATQDSFEGPDKFWMVFLGILLLGLAGWCLQAGFVGTASRYVAGETTPVVKDSATYLTDGQGFLGVGRTVDDAPTQQATGPFCSKCGTRNDGDASYYDRCGAALAH
jgi:hypothetical protein